MKKELAYLTAIISVLYFGVPGHAEGGGSSAGKQPSSDIPVTSTLQIAGDPLQSSNYSIEGDGLGSYRNGVDSVYSVLQRSSWDWILETTSSSNRTVLIDLRRPVPNSGAQQPFAFAYLPTRIIVKGQFSQSGSFRYMTLNQTLSFPAFVRFSYAGVDYRLVMSSGPNANPDYPETNNAQVTCTAVDAASTECAAWTIQPITQAGGAVQNVARLQRFGRGGRLTDMGNFYVNFLFNITNP